MIVSYVVIGLVSVVMLLASVATTTKAGKKDGICKYGNEAGNEE